MNRLLRIFLTLAYLLAAAYAALHAESWFPGWNLVSSQTRFNCAVCIFILTLVLNLIYNGPHLSSKRQKTGQVKDNNS